MENGNWRILIVEKTINIKHVKNTIKKIMGNTNINSADETNKNNTWKIHITILSDLTQCLWKNCMPELIMHEWKMFISKYDLMTWGLKEYVYIHSNLLKYTGII